MKRVQLKSIYAVLLALLLLPTVSLAQSSKEIDTLATKEPFKRDIIQQTFIKKGEVMLGLTASLGTLSSDNSSLLYLLNGLSASLSHTSVDPFVGYFYRDNKCVGLRLGFSTINGAIEEGVIDLGHSNDLEFDIPNIEIDSRSFNYSVFHRNYLALDRGGSFGLFAEVELEARNSNSTMMFDMGGATPQKTNSESFELNLGFNPGIVVFVLDNVSTNVSFGLGGLGYSNITQRDDKNQVTGSRSTSQLRFKFNITDINFGVTVHL